MMFRELDRKTLVADGQLQAADMAAAVERGVTTIVNNRPDGEEPGQPAAADLEAAAKAAGLAYVHIPIVAELSGDKVDALGAALERAEGLALLCCRSGTRSAYLWALARAREGALPEALLGNAARAGYNLRPILPWLKPKED
ncbi:MAG TPA: TIGR01244 family sulfur transferase [Allosphingosinicella sp.]|nr:TIGR01244 family sulfur transferase [Allosphingosinicella sp.]